MSVVQLVEPYSDDELEQLARELQPGDVVDLETDDEFVSRILGYPLRAVVPS